MNNLEYQSKEKQDGTLKVKKIEQEQSSVRKDTYAEIKDLGKNILSEKEKDLDVKNAIEKITAGCLKGALVNKLFLNQEIFENKEVSVYVDKVLKTNPEMWLFMQKLGIAEFINKKYEQLLPSQKMVLLTLDDTINGKMSKIVNLSYRDNKGNIDASKFETAYINNMKKVLNQINIDFKLVQLGNLGSIRKTLKKDYKLTEIEATKYIEYLEVIKNQPSKYYEAGLGMYAAGVVTGLLLATLGFVLYKQFINAPSETVIDTKIKLGNPELIARLLSEDVPFESTGSIEKEQFRINSNDGKIKEGFKKLINMAQTRKMTMQVTGKVAVEFDFDNSTMEYDPAKHAIFVRLKSPKTIIHEYSSKILGDNTQVWQTKDFDNIPMQLQDSLLNVAKNDVERNTKLIEQARKNTSNILMALYENPLAVAGQKLDSVYVEIIDANDKIIPKNNGMEQSENPIKINYK